MGALKDFLGKDKIRGRPIRLNRQRLETRKNKDYAELVFLGDIHFGHPGCDIDRAFRMRDYCLSKGVYVLGMGDYIEAGLRESVGSSVYEQKINPDQQLEFAIGFFSPLAERGLLLGLLLGNHEGRILKATSVNVVKLMAKALRVPYLHYACWNLFHVGGESYTLYVLHGTSSARYVHTKLKALLDISHNFNADILAMGHVHEIADAITYEQAVDKRNKMVVEKKKLHLLTGHYLKYDFSYAQERGYPLGKMGSPKIKLFANKHDVHLST